MLRLAAIMAVLATPLWSDTILSARFDEPTTRYPHGILGDNEEWGNLRIEVGANGDNTSGLFNWNRSLTYEVRLPDELVYEDVEPRLWDVTGDGAPEVVVVQSHRDLGARLLVIGLADGKPAFTAATPFIGRTNRWLAPIGAADLDGDGSIEIAYIDRPHLAKTLTIWRFADEGLTQVATMSGLTNHRIGESDIGGGLRDCGQGPEMITANADWTRVMATRLEDDTLSTRDIGRHQDRGSFAAALRCETLPG
ncbi:FG-GAP repeat domain-containing protein [Loktanella agnita]|uniref:FG-GAP repeat domain-containing protein n=1 Tax=Loktanella agnita TaxID=287097 RepID=UPI003989D617